MNNHILTTFLLITLISGCHNNEEYDFGLSHSDKSFIHQYKTITIMKNSSSSNYRKSAFYNIHDDRINIKVERLFSEYLFSINLNNVNSCKILAWSKYKRSIILNLQNNIKILFDSNEKEISEWCSSKLER